MKLAIAVACLAASLALASHALADGRTVATLQQPVAKPAVFTVDGGVWRCEGTACVASYTPPSSFTVSQCRDVAKHVHTPVSDFKDEDNNTLTQDRLDRCNAGIAPTTVAASH